MSGTLIPTETVYVLEREHWSMSFYDEAPTLDVVLPDNPRLRAAVLRLWADFDGLSCQAVNHPDSALDVVGWYLHTYEDNYGVEKAGERFAYTALVDNGERVYLLCEDCHCALVPKVVAE